jgi:hypothetical protein
LIRSIVYIGGIEVLGGIVAQNDVLQSTGFGSRTKGGGDGVGNNGGVVTTVDIDLDCSGAASRFIGYCVSKGIN